jgi:hypothetical protein
VYPGAVVADHDIARRGHGGSAVQWCRAVMASAQAQIDRAPGTVDVVASIAAGDDLRRGTSSALASPPIPGSPGLYQRCAGICRLRIPRSQGNCPHCRPTTHSQTL